MSFTLIIYDFDKKTNSVLYIYKRYYFLNAVGQLLEMSVLKGRKKNCSELSGSPLWIHIIRTSLSISIVQ